MSKRKFTYNFPSAAEKGIASYGTKAEDALMLTGFDIMDAAIAYLAAVKDGDAHAIQGAAYKLIFKGETAARMNEHFHNIDPDTYLKFGRELSYDDGTDVAMWFEAVD